MEKFISLTKRNAQQFFDAYTGSAEAVREEFRHRMNALGGPSLSELDYSPESLVPLWKWLCPLLKVGDALPLNEEVPMWYGVELLHNPHMQGITFSLETLWWIDGAAYYFGEVFIRNLAGWHWAICPDPKAYHRNKPVVLGLKGEIATPLHTMIIVTLQSINHSPLDHDGRLLEIFNLIQSQAEAQ